MFAMLLGPWPRVLADGTRLADLEGGVAEGRATAPDLAAAVERCVAETVAAQAGAGLGLVTDGGVRWADPAGALLDALRDGDTGSAGMLVRAWRAAAADVDVPVAAVLTGPWTLALADVGTRGDGATVAARALEIAALLADELMALAAAGCPVAQVVEPGAVDVGADQAARAGFARAHERLLTDAPDLHAMLAVTGGSAHAAGPEAILGAPYQSFLFDLIAGPDNWYLVRAVPGDRGVVCAALAVGKHGAIRDQAPELVWAAHYAASANGRGLDRVGLANASVLAGLEPTAARSALEAVVRAAALAVMPVREAVEAGLDPRIVTRGPVPALARNTWPKALP